jgi:hypothetical protein
VSRAAQWQPLCEADPTPGEPDEVGRAGRHYSEMAKEIKGQVSRLNDLVSGTLQGGYVKTLTEAADALKEDLGRTYERYREVGGALESWAPRLDGFQDEAEGLRRQALVAAGAMSDNRSVPTMTSVDAPPPPDAEVAAAKAMQGRYDDANADLSRLQGRLADLTERRDLAAAKVADFIRDKSDDSMADSPWDNFMDWMDDHHEFVSKACQILGVVAMAACILALVVPGLNVFAAIALGASALSLTGHTALAASGNGSWLDVGVDVVALGTLGAGRFLGPGIKVVNRTFGGALGRLTAETKAAGAMARGNTARMPIQAKVNAEVAQAQERLVGGVSNGVKRSVRRQVATIRASGTTPSQQAFDATESAYLLRDAPTTLLQRLAYGGGDSEIAAMRVQAQDAARGFSPTSRVGLAEAKTSAAYARSVGLTGASNMVSGASVYLEYRPQQWHQDLRDRWTTRKGDF